MKTIYRTFVFALVFLFLLESIATTIVKYDTAGPNRIFYLQHIKSKKYVALFNGTSGSLATLTFLPQYAQPFRIVKNDEGLLSFITENGDAALDKTFGCSLTHSDVGYYTTISGLKNQQFTINNIGTMGCKCCETCLVVPSSDYTHLIVRNYTCLYENNDDWKFSVSLTNSDTES